MAHEEDDQQLQGFSNEMRILSTLRRKMQLDYLRQAQEAIKNGDESTAHTLQQLAELHGQSASNAMEEAESVEQDGIVLGNEPSFTIINTADLQPPLQLTPKRIRESVEDPAQKVYLLQVAGAQPTQEEVAAADAFFQEKKRSLGCIANAFLALAQAFVPKGH